MRQLIGINTPFDGTGVSSFDRYEISEGVSILDYDAAVIYADNLCLEFVNTSYHDKYLGLLCLDEHQSNALVTSFETLKDLITEILKNGKNVYVLVGHNENCYIDTGRRQTSGTGRNAKTTRIVEEFNSFGFLPIDASTTEVYGSSVTPCCDGDFGVFFKNTAGLSCYQAYLEEPIDNVLAKAGDSDKVISSYCEYGSGRIVFLPPPALPDAFEMDQDYELCLDRYLKELIALDERLQASVGDFALPDWARDIRIPGEQELRTRIAGDEELLESLKTRIEMQQDKLQALERYKLLLTSSGSQLEAMVQDVLGGLGFELEKADPRRSDIIASFNGEPIVAEVKGLSKSAAEKNCAQLEKWASEYFAERGRQAKPLLIVNAYKNTPLADRSQPAFPDQMLAYAQQRGHCLISTTQLLCLYIDAMEDESRRETAVRKLLDTVGIYHEYEEPLSLLTGENSDEAPEQNDANGPKANQPA